MRVTLADGGEYFVWEWFGPIKEKKKKDSKFVPSRRWAEVRKRGYKDYRMFGKGIVGNKGKCKRRSKKKKNNKKERISENVTHEAKLELSEEKFVSLTGSVRARIERPDYVERPIHVMSKSASEIFAVPKIEAKKSIYLHSRVSIPRDSGLGFAIVIPSGEGKSTLVRANPNKYFDYEMRSMLPSATIIEKRGGAEFFVRAPDWNAMGNKILLVRTIHMVPAGFQVLGAFALCECRQSHPHVDGLLLPRTGGIRFNAQDREALPIGVTCCGNFSQRKDLMHESSVVSGFERKYVWQLFANRREMEKKDKSIEPESSNDESRVVPPSASSLLGGILDRDDKSKKKPWYYLI